MAVNLGSAYGKISLDVKGFMAGLRQAKVGATQLETGMGTLKTAVLGLVSAAALLKVGKTLFDFGEDAILAAARVQELEIINQQLGKNAGISGDQIKAETQEVRKMGIEAGVSNQVVAEFIRSHLDLSKASELARVAQDAATISGKNSTEALLGIITGIVTLQPEVIRTNGIVINLIGAETELADSLGISTNELTAAQKQQAALNAVLDAGTTVAGAYEAAMTSGSKILRSYPRYVNDILVNVGEPFLNAFNKGAKAVGEFLKKLGEMTAEGGKLRPIIDKLAEGAGLLVDKFVLFLEDFDAEKFAEGVLKAFDALGKFSQFIIDNWPLISIILTALAIKLAAKQFNPFNDGILGVIGNIIKFIGFVAGIVKVLEWLGISVGTVGGAFTTVSGIIGGAGTAIAFAFLPVLAVIASLILFAGIFAIAWKTNFLGIRDIINTSVKFWTNIFKAFFAFLKGDTAGAMEYLKEAWQSLVDHINNVFQKVFGIQDAWGKFLEWMRNALSRVVSYISDIFTRTNWSQLGRYITLGIANGMLLGLPALILVAAKTAEAALATIKAKLGIKSPSKAFEQLGMFSAQGYQLGLARAMSGDAIANAMTRPVNQLSNSNQQNLTIQMASGVTLKQMNDAIAANGEQMMNTLINFMGAA